MQQQSQEAKILCLGPAGSGKTLLLRKLQNIDAVDKTTTSVPTTGTDITTIKRINERNIETSIRIREVGGSMALIWSKYFSNIRKVLYVVDCANLCQISAAGVLLYTILAHPKLQNAKFMLVLTKMDLSYRQMRNEALLMLQMRRLQQEIKQHLQIVEASAIDGTGRNEIIEWLFSK